MQKWNFETKKYEPYKPPENGKYFVYSEEMYEMVNCAECGKSMLYGDGYTSLTIHTFMGFGYPVCKKCYEHEWELRKNAEK